MATTRYAFTSTPGQTIYVYPVLFIASPFALWTTNRVLMTEINGLYFATVDLSLSDVFAAFVGASAPTSYTAALNMGQYNPTTVAVTISGVIVGNVPISNNATITVYQFENHIVVVPYVGTDLTSEDIYFVVQGHDLIDRFVIPNASITRTSETFNILVPNTFTNTLQIANWSIRRTADASVIYKGLIQVLYAAYVI